MSRTKNRGFQQSFSPSYAIRRWRLGAYIRLSKEDLKKGKDDSNSVKNQRDLLNDFYQRHIEEFESITFYVDDGHTGTDANREDFQRILSDVMSGKVNCVAVKDLSRFARNYSDAGSLIDNLFVQMGPLYQPCGKCGQLYKPGQRFQHYRPHYECNERSILLSDFKENPAGI